ncbi:hypothetical protein ALP83_200028 [Pseudomonas syringae pv. actinidiae]|uniref:Uncharacterized protein n=1 Tax=Pseudomonas syringae pv. actinidiae TaxID=103796 RepID=A0A7Z6UHQ0_PSESF|nr:hypothetical protein ALP83_200028 [Pseudomonas syringae pv. actinidiae]
MKANALRCQRGEGIDGIGKDDAMLVRRVFDVPEKTFLLAPTLHEVGVALVELSDVGQRCVFTTQVQAVIAFGLFVHRENGFKNRRQILVLPDAAVEAVFKQAEPRREDQLPVMQAAVIAQVAHTLDKPVALRGRAVIAENRQADGLADEFFRIVFGVLHHRVKGVARNAPDALDPMHAQGLELMLAQRCGELQQAFALAEGGTECQIHGAAPLLT